MQNTSADENDKRSAGKILLLTRELLDQQLLKTKEKNNGH
jgi:hypothetical protein